MHLLDGIYVPIGLRDTVSARKNDGGFSATYDTGAKYGNDTVLRVCELIKDFYGLKGGADFYVEKRIPEQRGLGGSSTDAGAAARLLQKMYDLPEIDLNLLVKAGSDVPYTYKGGTKRVKGLGEIVEDIILPQFYTVTLYPSSRETQGVFTKECFALYDKIGDNNENSGDIDGFLNDFRVFNDLSESAKILCPAVKEGLDMLKSAGFSNISVSGSGSAVFALERNEREFNEKLSQCLINLPKNFDISS